MRQSIAGRTGAGRSAGDTGTLASMTTHPASWRKQLASQARHLFWLKLVGTSVWIWIFFIGYFQLLRHPVHAVTPMPLTALDAMIPFQPAMLAPYLSLWLYVGIAPGLMPDFRSLLVYGLWTAALCLSGLGLFYLWPTTVPPLPLADAGAAGFRMLQGIDANGNACPSMHVAFAMFTGLWIDHLLRRAHAPRVLQAANLAWFLAITWSTLASRQHVVLDALAGGVLGALFAGASLGWQFSVRRARSGPGGAAMIDRTPADMPP